MGKFRIYPDKSNTLIEGTEINTGKNGVMELWYGTSGITRHLIHFNLDSYNTLYAQGFVPHVTATTASFHMKNCYPIFDRPPYENAVPATNADIEVKVIQQNWDEGQGYQFYDFGNPPVVTIDDKSNWYSATTALAWNTPGGDFLHTIFSGTVETGGADISTTMSNEVEFWNSFTGDNHGFVVKYTDEYESLTGETKHILKYYNEKTLTSHLQPYIDLTWVDTTGSTGTSITSSTLQYFVTMPTLLDHYDQSTIVNLPVNVYPRYTSNEFIVDNMEWRLIQRDGTINDVVIDWTQLPWTADGNYIELNTYWMLPNVEYIIDVRYVHDSVVINGVFEIFKFRVIEDN